MSLSLALLSSHLLSDFPLQTDHMAEQKLKSPLTRTIHVLVHMVVAGTFVYLVVGLKDAIIISTLLGILHFCIDSKRWAEPKEGFEIYPIAVDQSLHITSLFFVSLVVT